MKYGIRYEMKDNKTQVAANGGAGYFIAFLVAFSGKNLYNLADFQKYY
jgi:hypothetical protein